MYSLVLLTALTSTTQAPGFHPKQYPYGWPYGARGWCCSDCSFIPYWYSGTYTFYPNYYSPFGMSQYAQPWVPGNFGPVGGYPIPGAEGGDCAPGSGMYGPKANNQPLPSRLKNESLGASTREKAGVFQSELVLEIPENATLYVNGTKMKPGSGLRTFHTPQLPLDQKHFYDFRLETVKNGKVQLSEKTIEVKPGKMELAGIFTNEKDLARAGEKVK